VDREIRIEGHRLIRAPVQRVWQLLSRLESHPRYADLWMVADLVERSQTAALVEFRGFFGGLPITSVQRVVMRPPSRIEFRQARGTLREFWGAYILKDADGDTDLTVQFAADPGIVFFTEASVQQILASHIDGMLAKLKASAERDLVRLTPRRSQAPADSSPASGPAGATPATEELPAAEEETADAETAEPPAPGVTAPSSARRPEGRGRRRRRRRGRQRGTAPRTPAVP
jgi:uncharacterized protein YndB with AHSA1/START domain